MISAKVIAHSTYAGADVADELITMEVEFHRWILSEINTHRVLSRNYQSSRAVPVEKLIEQVRNNPAIPVHWGKNQRGMVAEQENNEPVLLKQYDKEGWEIGTVAHHVETTWREAAREAGFYAEAMHKAGYHKQIVNRLLEPFMWTRGVITATRGAWESVFALRCHPDAQPEFQALAYKVREAIINSTPELLQVGEWHLPYVSSIKSSTGMKKYFTGEWIDDRQRLNSSEAMKVSTSCCAQVSYRQLDDSLQKALKIYDMLNLPEGGKFKEAPAHMSPCEHQACVHDWWNRRFLAGNFATLQKNNWAQHRKILELGYEKEFIK